MSKIIHNGVLVHDEGQDLIKEKPWPILNGLEPLMKVNLRATFERNKDEPNSGPWLAPMPLKWPNGLNPRMIVQTDGKRTIVRERREPMIAGPSVAPSPANISQCIAPEVDFVSVDPPDNPLTLGSSYTFTVSFLVLPPYSAFNPLIVKWYLNGALQATYTQPPDASRDWSYVLLDSDIVAKDPSGLGQIVVYAHVQNNCGSDETPPGAFAAQGNPPP